ncbi:unnamed protein product [Triticum turgidum subsp. durum]|uniref:Protein CLT2, chloroplastic n=1 Tax=Triticum turgidum subsp. durum TaxID=4567 RepID=A0A9R0T7N5_TRITD|nr:unnamed protein product [Triticum turgidum subsp. durum]
MNRVLYKLALVPMKNYPFFLAQVLTFGYVVVYFSILFVRYQAGIVTKEMLALPKSRFMLIGLLEAMGVASGMAAAAMLPGPSIPVLSQLILSVIVLGRKYRANQILGCLLVTTGVILSVVSGANGGSSLSDVKFFWPAVLMASSACQAGASIIKEFVFIDGAKRLEGKRPDIFVVNSFGSGFQALFVLLLLPFLSNLKGIPLTELPAYVNRGAACFLNVGGNLNDCPGAPLLPLLFITMNMAFNISVLNLVKMSTALVASLTATLAVPLSIYVLSLPLPYMPGGTSLSTSFLVGAAVLVLGLLLYNLPQNSADQVKTE